MDRLSSEGRRPDPPSGAAVVELCLFVVGESGPSVRARRELEAFRVARGGGGWRIDVVDVLERPEVAERERILATPVLIRMAPLPRRSIIGDLSDWEAVAEVLELRTVSDERGHETEGG